MEVVELEGEYLSNEIMSLSIYEGNCEGNRADFCVGPVQAPSEPFHAQNDMLSYIRKKKSPMGLSIQEQQTGQERY